MDEPSPSFYRRLHEHDDDDRIVGSAFVVVYALAAVFIAIVGAAYFLLR